MRPTGMSRPFAQVLRAYLVATSKALLPPARSEVRCIICDSHAPTKRSLDQSPASPPRDQVRVGLKVLLRSSNDLRSPRTRQRPPTPDEWRKCPQSSVLSSTPLAAQHVDCMSLRLHEPGTFLVSAPADMVFCILCGSWAHSQGHTPSLSQPMQPQTHAATAMLPQTKLWKATACCCRVCQRGATWAAGGDPAVMDMCLNTPDTV